MFADDSGEWDSRLARLAAARSLGLVVRLRQLASGHSTFSRDNGLGEGDALSALKLAPEATIGSPRIARAVPHGIADLAFPQGVANANDHAASPANDSQLAVVRLVRNSSVAVFLCTKAAFARGRAPLYSACHVFSPSLARYRPPQVASDHGWQCACRW